MKKVSDIMWGLILIIIGVILGGNALDIFNINLFFDGWWTLFIIVPTFIGLVTERDKTGNIIGLIIGLLLLLSCRGLFDFKLIWKLIFPLIFVIIGLSLIFKNNINKEVNEKIKKLNENLSSNDVYTATFSGQNLNFDGEEFKGSNLNAIFGGIKLDLRKAIINEDIVINASSIFGGIDIYIPDNCKVKIKSNSIFGGVSNNKKCNVDDNSYTIYINASCMFGGVEIK